MKILIFWIGVNVIGIPEAFVHEVKPHIFTTKSKWFGDKKTTVFLFKQYYL
jgi:hypothetical protein